MRGHERVAQIDGILERDVGADAAIGSHRVDRIADQGGASRRPRRDRGRGANRKARERGGIRQIDEVAEAGTPRRHRTGGGRCEGSTVEALGIVAEAERPALAAQRPHQIAAGVVEEIAGIRGRSERPEAVDITTRIGIELLHRREQPQSSPGGDEGQAVGEDRREPLATALIEKDLAGNADNAGIDALGMWKELAPHARAAAVGRNQDIALGRGAVLEMGDDAAIRAFLIAHEGLAEMDNVIEPGKQDPPQHCAAHGAMLGDRVLRAHQLTVDREQHLHLLGHEAERLVRFAAGAIEDVEEVRREAGMERAAAGRIDMHPIALQAVRQRAIALVGRDADASLLEPMRKTEAADAATDDDDMERNSGCVERFRRIGRGHRRIPARWTSTRNAPIEIRNSPRPIGEPQPYQVIALSAYFHASASCVSCIVILTSSVTRRRQAE